MSINPYEAPLFESPRFESSKLIPTRVYVDGKHLVVPSEATLPLRCVKTNEPITEMDIKRRDLYWCSPLVALLIFCNVLVLLVVYLVVRKKCSVIYGLHPSVRKRYRIAILVKSIIAIVLFCALFPLGSLNDPMAFTIALILFIFSILAVFIGNSPLRVTKYKDGAFWIKGCSPEFLLSLSDG